METNTMVINEERKGISKTIRYATVSLSIFFTFNSIFFLKYTEESPELSMDIIFSDRKIVFKRRVKSRKAM